MNTRIIIIGILLTVLCFSCEKKETDSFTNTQNETIGLVFNPETRSSYYSTVYQHVVDVLSSYGAYEFNLTSEFFADFGFDEFEYHLFLNSIEQDLDVDLPDYYVFQTVGQLVNYIDSIIQPVEVSASATLAIGAENFNLAIECYSTVSWRDTGHSELRNQESFSYSARISSANSISYNENENAIRSITYRIRQVTGRVSINNNLIWEVILQADYRYHDNDSIRVIKYSFEVWKDLQLGTSQVRSSDVISDYYTTIIDDGQTILDYSVQELVYNSVSEIFNYTVINDDTDFYYDINASSEEMENFFDLIGERLHIIITDQTRSQINTVSDIISSVSVSLEQLGTGRIPPETAYSKLIFVISDVLQIDNDEISLYNTLISLGADNLDFFDIILGLEDELCIYIPEEHATVLYSMDLIELYRYLITFPLD